jgi:hypothetical protein
LRGNDPKGRKAEEHGNDDDDKAHSLTSPISLHGKERASIGDAQFAVFSR